MTSTQLSNELSYCTGSESFSQLMPGFYISEGVRLLCEEGHCFWLLDAIGSHQFGTISDPKDREFQVWEISLDPESSKGELFFKGAGEQTLIQTFAYCEFPFPHFTIWVAPNDMGTLTAYLPSEH